MHGKIEFMAKMSTPTYFLTIQTLCSMHTQQLRRQKLFCCRPSGVERLAITSVAGHELQTFQACTDICLGHSRPRRIVTD